MRELGFEYKPINGYNTYNITFDKPGESVLDLQSG